MGRHSTDAKEKILQSAFELFEEQGYERTTVDNIISASGYSKGTFYHYFTAKEELLLSWVTSFDEHYHEWFDDLDEDMSALEKISEFNRHILDGIEFNAESNYIASIFAAQITSKSERVLMNRKRSFIQILHQILKDGQRKGEIRNDISPVELAKIFVTLQNGIIYEWCASAGSFSLREFGDRIFNMIAPVFKTEYN